MFTYVLPISEINVASGRCYFKIWETVFDVNYASYEYLTADGRYRNLLSDDRKITVQVTYIPLVGLAVKTEKKIDYIAGRNAISSYYDDECDQFMI